MRFEPPPISKSERIMSFEELMKEIDPYFQRYVEDLKKEGIPVDDNGRIEMEKFEKIFGRDVILGHGSAIKGLLKKFEGKEVGELTGEFMERFVPLIFRDWFQNRIIVIRTSEYDDYFNGVDHLILHPETLKVLAAIDTTTNWKEKIKNPKVMETIKKGVKIFYGVNYTKEGKINFGSLNEIPIFIIPIPSDELITIAENYLNRISTFENKVKILNLLIEQSSNFQKICDEIMKIHYSLCEKIFRELLKEK
jgi:hypothetical protein